MEREELLKEVLDALANGNDLKKVKVKYQNGDVIKFNFDEDEEEEEEEEDEEEDEEEEDEEEEEDDEDKEEDQVEDKVKNKEASYPTSSQVSQPEGRKVNVINRP
ncbi:hypothetical protein [Desulfitobacterium sp.]|uniref:hypothetical protein n=1 Tax=Desulfitobacterium sp. TaxID=49981 RepID=UPI002B9C815E|nr:hypothetical protein [Desulfitobacterium sp.]HVJ48772.1 hypothetical protein [Desulfitobacterium sp.]